MITLNTALSLAVLAVSPVAERTVSDVGASESPVNSSAASTSAVPETESVALAQTLSKTADLNADHGPARRLRALGMFGAAYSLAVAPVAIGGFKGNNHVQLIPVFGALLIGGVSLKGAVAPAFIPFSSERIDGREVLLSSLLITDGVFQLVGLVDAIAPTVLDQLLFNGGHVRPQPQSQGVHIRPYVNQSAVGIGVSGQL
jgi:hypothetical protein